MGTCYNQLSVQECHKIEDWWHAKAPVAEMARVLKRHKSTIFAFLHTCAVGLSDLLSQEAPIDAGSL